MTVFKGYLRIVRANLGQLLMYVGIFLAICVAISRSNPGGTTESFTQKKLNAAVIDRDGGSLGTLLEHYIGQEHNRISIADDPQVLQEELYYRNVEYILIIPEGAQERMLAGETDGVVQCVTAPGSTAGYYVDAQIGQLLSHVHILLAGGFSMKEACEQADALSQEKGTINLVETTEGGSARTGYHFFYAYLPYALFGSIIMTLGIVIMEFKKKEIRRRMQSAPIPFVRQNLAGAAALLVVCTGIWVFYLLLQAVIYQGGIFRSGHAAIYMLNSFSCMLVALSLGYFTGMISENAVALNGINNVLSLGLCFLGGVFVPLEMLGNGIVSIAQFLPTYWYSRINGILRDYGELSSELWHTIWAGLLIQLAFALACFGVTMMLRRGQLQERG